jgi:PhnB protein
MGAISAKTIGNTPVSLMMYVKSCDKAIEKAVKHGATVTQPAEDKFWGDRSGQIKDPFGHLWTFGTVIEVLSVKEVKKRMKAMGM